jgi:hypothetical protein
MADHDRHDTARTGGRHPRRRPKAARRTGHARRRPTSPWYATDPSFQRHLERGLYDIAEHRRRVTVALQPENALQRRLYRVLVYHHAGLDVPGRRHPVPVEVQFYEDPDYVTYGLSPADYPRVVAEPGAASKHRMPDDALCLYYPNDHDDRRWKHTDGLPTLFEIVRHHLLYEDYWRATGGHGDGRGHGEGIWLGDEAPHGFDGDDRRAA